MLVRGWRDRAALAMASAALTLLAAACDGPDRTDRTPAPAGPPVAMSQLLRGIASAKADLAQYQLDLTVACHGGGSGPCWRALRSSTTIGEDLAADLSRVGAPPLEVADLWERTTSAVAALRSVAARSCGPGPPLASCSGAVGRSVESLSLALARWDVYVAWK
jgi:hypothetical protein